MSYPYTPNVLAYRYVKVFAKIESQVARDVAIRLEIEIERTGLV